MKKLFVTFLTLILCVFIFTSCRFKPESAADVMAKIDEKMDSLKSYQSDMTAEMTTKIQGMDCSASFTGQHILLEDYYYQLMEGSTTIKTGGLISDTETTVEFKGMEAFYDGKMFIWNEQTDPSKTTGDLVQRLYSPLTKEEFSQYLENKTDDLDIDYNACVNSTFVQNEDKSWTLTYSGYTKKVIEEVVEAFGDELFEDEIVDMEITIQANKDFTVKEIVINMVFEDSATSSFQIRQQYSKYDEATAVTDTLDTNVYTEIADCRLLKDFEDMLEDLEEAENGSFVLDLNQSLTIQRPSGKQDTSETDTVRYGKKDGKYFYTVQASYDGADIGISYENGKQTVTVGGGSQTVDQTEEEAKAFIDGLINTASYDSIRVSGIQKVSDGVYKIRCAKPSADLYQPVMSSLGIHDPDVSQTITISVDDGKITKIESTLEAKGENMTYSGATFKITSINTFDHSVNDKVA